MDDSGAPRVSAHPQARRLPRVVFYTATVYGLWVLFNVYITVTRPGDGGIGAHLVLLFTGLPAASASLLLPHATLEAVVIAGVLGLVQWCGVVWLYAIAKRERRHNAV